MRLPARKDPAKTCFRYGWRKQYFRVEDIAVSKFGNRRGEVEYFKWAYFKINGGEIKVGNRISNEEFEYILAFQKEHTN